MAYPNKKIDQQYILFSYSDSLHCFKYRNVKKVFPFCFPGKTTLDWEFDHDLFIVSSS